MEFSHLDDQGKAKMVDVSAKDVTERTAIASGLISIKPDVIRMITDRKIPKGDVLATARIAGIMAAKRTSELIPMCHPLAINHVSVDFIIEKDRIKIIAAVKVTGKTGVEMESLTAVSVAALTIYDMCKSMDKSMAISQIQLDEKCGGRSGHYVREKNDENS
jgi:cyclic pyranopterin phosphate synthase